MRKFIWTIKDLNSLTLEDFGDPEIYGQVKGMAIEFVNSQDFDACRQAYKVLNERLQQFNIRTLPIEYAQNYRDLLRLLEIGQVRFFDASRKAKYFKDSILLLLKLGLDPREIFDIGFIFSDYLGESDKATARYAFEQNTEVLGMQHLEIESRPQPERPTIQNWLADYRIILAKRNLELDSYGKSYYFSNSKNVSNLTENERQLLAEILDFYEWLQKPSLLPIGFISAEEAVSEVKPVYMKKETLSVPGILSRVAPPLQPTMPKIRPPVPRPPVPKPPTVVARRQETGVREELKTEKPTPSTSPPSLREGEKREGILPQSPVASRPSPSKVLPPPPRPPVRPVVIEKPKDLKTEKPLSAVSPKLVSSRPLSPSTSLRATLSGIEGVARGEGVGPRTASLNEELYRSTLEELAKMRQEAGIKKQEPIPSSSPPSQGGERVGVEPFSVNEALIHAGQQQPVADQGENHQEAGQVVPGEKDVKETQKPELKSPSAQDQEVEKKLKELEDKLK